MKESTTILVTGSTGTIGSRTVQSLASNPGVSVRAAVHGRPAGPLPDNAEVVRVDYEEPETIRAAAAGVDAVLLITPSVPNQVGLAECVIDAVRAAAVPRIVRLSSLGADWEDPALFMREHTETENDIVRSGISCTFLRPNSYMYNFVNLNPPDAEGNIYLPWGDAGVSLVDPRDVADVAALVLTSDDHVGKAYSLTGPEAVTGDEIAAAISEATGRSITYIDVPEEGMRQAMLGEGMPPIVVDGVLDLCATQKAGKMAAVTETVSELSGRPARSFAEFARDHSREWKVALGAPATQEATTVAKR